MDSLAFSLDKSTLLETQMRTGSKISSKPRLIDIHSLAYA